MASCPVWALSGAGGTAVVGVAGAGGGAGGATPAEVTPQVVPGVGPAEPMARAEQRDAPHCYQCGNAMQPAVVLRVRELWHHQRLLVI